MATIYDGAAADETTSHAEKQLKQLFQSLPDDYTIIHSATWNALKRSHRQSVGEVDFVVAHPKHGVILLEVKGGKVRVERGQWISTSRSGNEYDIKDPAEQAKRSVYALLDWLRHDSRTKDYSIALYHGVALPDSRVVSDVRPDCPTDIIIDMADLDNLEASLERIYAYWQQRKPLSMGGDGAVQALVELLVPTRSLHPKIAEVFERERRKIRELTEQQYRVLRRLRHYNRVPIIGGAGTGKTMLALEKTTQLADAGMRVLFLCYNKELNRWIDQHFIDHDNVLVSTFFSFVAKTREWAGIVDGSRQMKWPEFEEHAPELLLNAAMILHEQESDQLFDAIIVDEAQDFADTWWIGVREMLKDPDEGIFYVFFDNNQRIYTQITDVPMDIPPQVLDENLRNTQGIHDALLPYMITDEQTICVGPEGREVEHIDADNPKEMRDAVRKLLHRFVNEQGVDPTDIIILTPRGEQSSEWKSEEMLGNFAVTWDMETDMPMTVRISTIYSYKGLESAIAILTEMDQTRVDISNQLVYVALSRARNHAVVVGDLPEPSV